MRKCVGELIAFKAGELYPDRPAATASVRSGDDVLFVERRTRKQAIRAANRLLKKLGWKLKGPWEAK